jgi:putative endopeptidase
MHATPLFRSFVMLALSVAPTLAMAATAIPDILDESALKDGSTGRGNVAPCDDFYQFACGNWMDHTTIPSDRSSIYHQSSGLADQTDALLHTILLHYSKGDFRVKSTYAKMLGDEYASCMARDKTATSSKAILRAELAKIAMIHDSQSLAEGVANLHLLGASAFFGLSSAADPNNSKETIAIASTGGMSLPDKDYYLNTDAKSLEIVAKFQAYIRALFVENGATADTAATAASQVFAIEKFLASKALSLDERNDPAKTNHPMSVTEFAALAPNFNWKAYFAALGLPNLSSLNVTEPVFYANIGTLLTKFTLAETKVYLEWLLIDRAANSTGPENEKLSFGFWNRYLNGQKTPKARWKDCTARVENSLGYALAEAYVGQLDGAAIKARVEAMILQIKAAFADDLDRLANGQDAWMDQATEKAALEKLALLGQKVGAPDKWQDYDALKLGRVSFLENSLNISKYSSRRDLAKIGKPVDRSEWYMMPWEINAYYDPSTNEFNFPFGILQPPSFDLKASDGANLGAFGGGTIGHELTHGWDDDGRKYDGYGNIKDWWSPETKAQFETKSACYVEQANAYPIIVEGKTFTVNGAAIITENLADQGGVKLGYVALEKILQSRAPVAPWLGKYTENQTYWIAYAQSWCAKRSPESMRSLITTNPHPPEEFRVNGVLMNRPEFASDFGCKAGDRMVPAKRCSIW